jgi:hypothetical protein
MDQFPEVDVRLLKKMAVKRSNNYHKSCKVVTGLCREQL